MATCLNSLDVSVVAASIDWTLCLRIGLIGLNVLFQSSFTELWVSVLNAFLMSKTEVTVTRKNSQRKEQILLLRKNTSSSVSVIIIDQVNKDPSMSTNLRTIRERATPRGCSCQAVFLAVPGKLEFLEC